MRSARLVQFDALTAEVGDCYAFCESRSTGEQEREKQGEGYSH